MFSAVALFCGAVFCGVGTVLLAREGDISAAGWMAWCFGMPLALSLPALLILLSVRTYEILREDGILVKRLTKTKFVSYADMASYRWSNGQLTVYDRGHAVLFFVGENRVGLTSLLLRLDEKGIPHE